MKRALPYFLVVFALSLTGCGASPANRAAPTDIAVSPVSSTAVTVSATVASPVPQPSATATPPGRVGKKVSYLRGETVREAYGLLLLNPQTGGADVWEMPQTTYYPGIGLRYFLYAPAFEGIHLIDIGSGNDVPLAFDDEPVCGATLSPDEGRLAVVTAHGGAVIALPSGSLVTRFSPVVPGPLSSGDPLHCGLEALWSPSSEALVVTRDRGDGSVTEFVKDTSISILPDHGHAAWAHDGSRFILTTPGRTAVYGRDGRRESILPFGGGLPAWSTDDAFFAIDLSTPGPDGARELITVVDTATMKEALRIYRGFGCFASRWSPANEVRVWGGYRVEVPSGTVRGGQPEQPGNSPTGPVLRVEGAVVKLTEGTSTLAEVRVAASAISLSGDGAAQNPGAVMLGQYGKGCIGPDLGVIVERPPFP